MLCAAIACQRNLHAMLESTLCCNSWRATLTLQPLQQGHHLRPLRGGDLLLLLLLLRLELDPLVELLPLPLLLELLLLRLRLLLRLLLLGLLPRPERAGGDPARLARPLGGVLLLRLGGLRAAGLLAGDGERRRGGLRPYPPGRPGGPLPLPRLGGDGSRPLPLL